MADILIVDDSSAFRTVIRRSLERAGHKILGEGANADEALKLLKKHQADIMLLDLLMPGKSGLDVLKKIKKDKHNLNVLIVTAVNRKPINERAKKYGAKKILYKPFDSDEMLKMVDEISKK